MTKHLLKSTTALLAVAAFAAPTAAFSQEGEIQDVITVTAQNREQNVQDVPIAINVITGEELADSGFSDLNDIDKIAPAVQLNQDQGTVKVTVRGVGTTSNDEAQDTSVVVNIDGEYINRLHVLSSAMFDMERVEVLRGPQGTLYGRNSTGGAINFITRKPGDDFGVNGSVSYGNYDAIRVDGGTDIPLGDVAGFRLAGFYETRNGYVKHDPAWGFGPFPAFDGGRSDDDKAWGGRATFAVNDLNGFSLNLAGEYSQREFVPSTFAFVDLNSGGNGPAGPGCNAPGYEQVAPLYMQTLCVPSNTDFLSTVDRENFTPPAFGLGHREQDTWAVRGRVSYEFSPAAVLTYTGGYREYKMEPGSFLTLPVVYTQYTFQNEIKTQSHELRLNGAFDNGIVYQIGGFYFKEDQDVVIDFTLFQNIAISYFERFVESDSWSGFGQFEFPLTDTLTLVAGARYTDNSRSAIYNNASAFGAGPPDPLLFMTAPVQVDFADLAFGSTLLLGSADDKLTWLAGLNYTPDDDTLLYAKVTTGFKGGGFDSVGTYKPETNRAYEAGLKKGFGPHIFNASAFYYDYKDLQVSVLLDTTIGGQTFNAASATIWGLEAETELKVSEAGTFTASVNYLNAEYDEFLGQYNVFTVPGTGDDLNGIGDLDPTTMEVEQPNFAGNRPPFSPKWIFTAGYSHAFDTGGGTLTASAFTTFKSSYFTEFFNYNDSKQKSFTKTDLSLEYAPHDGYWSLQLFARNIEDKRTLTYGSFVSAGPDDIYDWQFGTPRTYGVRLAVDY